MIVEIAPQPRIGARLGRNADGIQSERKQSYSYLKFHTCTNTDRAHNVEVEVVVRLLQVNRLVG